jgi:phosphatidylglycerol:prolipoprotein diacylglycerol transferase
VYPRLFTFGNVTLPTYGAFMAIAVMAALLLAMALARRTGLDRDRMWTLGLLAVFSAIAGSRVIAILSNWSSVVASPRLLLNLPALQSQGVDYTGILLALVVCAGYLAFARPPVLRTLDTAAPAVALGHAIAAMGCLMAGCGYGQPITGAGHHWGILFNSRFAERTTGVPLGIPLYPTQIYDSAAALLICAVLLFLLARPHRDGDVAGAWLFLFGLARFFLEFYRGDPGRGSLLQGACTGVQAVAVTMVVLGGVLWSVSQNQNAGQPADVS